MRMIFGLMSLLLIVAVVGILAKKQLSAVTNLPTATGTGNSATSATSAPAANVAEQSQQMQQVKDQISQAMEAAAVARAQAESK